jgi:hypothetical protein
MRYALELVLDTLDASKSAAGGGKKVAKRKRRQISFCSDHDEELGLDDIENSPAFELSESSRESEAEVSEASEAPVSEEPEEEEEPEESGLLSFEVAGGKSLALLTDFISDQGLQTGKPGKFSRIGLAASFLSASKVHYRAFWNFAREWEQKKLDVEGDKKVAKCLGRDCTVVLEGYKIGKIKVRAEPPQQSTFKSVAGVEHGHAICYDFRPDPSAGKETLEWDLGDDVFVSQDGDDLKSFSSPMNRCKGSGADIFIFYEVLKPLAKIR